MMVVIADDLSGAAELAGIAQSCGLSAEVQTAFDPRAEAGVVAVDSNTRSRPGEEARLRTAQIAAEILASRPEWIYKKTDSVLRGHPLVEITALLEASGKKRALLIPANPSRGRLIRDGHYFVDGIPLDQTAFAADHQYPAKSSSVRQLLGKNGITQLHLISEPGEFRTKGLIVPDIRSATDLEAYARLADDSMLCAGGGEFFEALLRRRIGRSKSVARKLEPKRSATTLFVCGSAAAWTSRQRQCQEQGIPIMAMPNALKSEALELDWVAATVLNLVKQGSAMMAIGEPANFADVAPRELEKKLAGAVDAVLRATTVERLFLEGGATASAVLRQIKGTRLTLCGEFAPGLAALQVAGRARPILAIKPGSYEWPENVWPAGKRRTKQG